MTTHQDYDDLINFLKSAKCCDETLCSALDKIYKLSYKLGSSPEELEELRLQLDEEKRTYASRIIYGD